MDGLVLINGLFGHGQGWGYLSGDSNLIMLDVARWTAVLVFVVEDY